MEEKKEEILAEKNGKVVRGSVSASHGKIRVEIVK